MTAPTLPPIGRNGIVNSVRRLSGVVIPGYRNVDTSAEFIAGMVGKLAHSGGVTYVTNVSAVTDAPIGIIFNHKTISFYRPVYKEEITFTGANSAITLAHANVKSGSVLVEKADGTDYTVTTDYTVNINNGIITQVGGGGIGTTETVYVSYRYTDPNLTGIDQTIGSGKVSMLEGKGEIATMVYDTTAAYTLGADVFFDASGIPTTTDGGSAVKIGTVTKVPASDDVELHIKIDI